MKKAAIYVKHKMNAYCSIESKIMRCKDFAKCEQLEVVDTYYDCVKDNTQKRYALEQLLKDCETHKFECVIILSISNVTRKIDEFIRIYKELKKNNIELYSLMYEAEDLHKLEVWL